MKIMIASDIHGSAKYCRELLEAFRREKAEKLVLLGDILYHGPRNDLPEEYAPKSVIEQLNAVKDSLLCVRGNCDTEVDQMVLAFPILADYAWLYAADRTVFVTHGHGYGEENLPPLSKGSILLQGHTHIPRCVDKDGVLCVNPGSVSIPKESSPHSYLMMTDTELTWKDLAGTVFSSQII